MRRSPQNGERRVLLSLCLRLKGRAKRFPRGVSAVRAYRDLACGAMGVTVVVNTVFNITANALDMLLAATLFG